MIALPPERQPELVGDADAVPTRRAAFQWFKAIAGRTLEIHEALGDIQYLQLAPNHRPNVRLLERVGMRRAQTKNAIFRGEPCVEFVYAVARGEG
jgi:hypothetical protein